MNHQSRIIKKNQKVQKTEELYSHTSNSRGFTLFIAVIVSSLFLAIAFSLASLSIKQQIISSIGKESQFAFYAADTGIECAFYWDFKGTDVFATSTQSIPSFSGVNCNGRDIATNWDIVRDATQAKTTFAFNFSPQPYCTVVTVEKIGTLTTIESRGYNNASLSGSSCTSSNPRTVERAIRVNY